MCRMIFVLKDIAGGAVVHFMVKFRVVLGIPLSDYNIAK